MPVKCEEMVYEDLFPATDTSLYMMDLEEEDWSMTFLNQTPMDLLNQNFDPTDTTACDFIELLMPQEKPQIRHHDCMWSGTCRDKSHPLKKKGQANACVNSTCGQAQPDKIKTEPLPKITIAKNLLQPFKPENRAIKVEAGRSLLINRNPQSQNAFSLQISQQSELSYPLGQLRPDTPLSLTDEAPEFKHSIDFGKIKMGDSGSSAKYISMLKEHLEDPSSEPYYGKKCTPAGDLNDILTDITFLSDYEDMGDDCSTIDMDDDEASDEGEQDSEKNHRISSKFQNAAMSTVPPVKSKPSQQYTTEYMGDHSYTRPKNRYDLVGLGVQTPSDSEEEIDGDSVGDKTLPTNPSARDRRALQTTVAHKMARISKTAYNQQRRRVSDDDGTCSSLSTASSQSNTPVKVGAMYASNHSKSESRKRQSHPKDSNNNDHSSSKKYSKSSKKQRLALQTKQQALQKAAAAATEDLEEAETVEKRNLHNNMERQRRIGLKNLFEELKRQIPTLKDKERAPKVNILREAAAYCHKLKRDDDLHNELLKKQNRLLARVRSLRSQQHQQRKF